MNSKHPKLNASTNPYALEIVNPYLNIPSNPSPECIEMAKLYKTKPKKSFTRNIIEVMIIMIIFKTLIHFYHTL